ncbi:MAG: phosphoglucomutase/phosphomannomutase family protein [Elusimicrobiota bacterium]
MSEKKINFGTAGWRGIIGDDFTFENVRIVSQSIAEYIKETTDSESPEIAVGYDTRFLSEDFAKASSEVLAANNIKVHYSDKDVPTPVVSSYIIDNKMCGGVNITASHNPPFYSGIKYSPYWGGPAMPEVTNKIEQKIKSLQKNPNKIKKIDFDLAKQKSIIEVADFSKTYMDRIKRKIDLELIEKNVSLVFDAMYSTARSYMSDLLPNAKLKTINNYRDVLFGNRSPEPSEKYLSKMISIVRDEGYDIGIATDGDADRFGIIDSDGSFIAPNQVLGLVMYHLSRKKYKGIGVRSVMTSSFIDAVGREVGVDVLETPVGFKYIGDIFTKQDIIVGGEESGGLTIGGHLPEKDGILACLLMAEIRAYEGKSIKDLLNELYQRVGCFVTERRNYVIGSEKMGFLRENLKKKLPDKIGGLKVEEVKTLDGYKFMFNQENSWLGLRFSGTEPLVRLYVESSSTRKVESILKSAEEIFKLKD